MDLSEMQVCYTHHPDPKLRRVKMPIFDEQVQEELDRIARRFECVQIGFVYDIYLLLKSGGIALKGRKKARSETLKQFSALRASLVEKVFSRHWATLSKMRKLSYFNKLCQIKDTYDAVERLLSIFQKLSRKTQPSRCNSCSLMKVCRFGSQYTGKLSDPVDGKAPDMSLAIHGDCKEPPQADVLANAVKALAILAVIMDPVQGAAMQAMLEKDRKHGAAAIVAKIRMANAIGSPGDVFDTSFTGEIMLQQIENAVDEITSKQLAIFELARTFNEKLLPEGDEDKNDTEMVTRERRVRVIKDDSEVSRAVPHEHIDDDLFDKKFANKELMVVQHQDPRKKKQYFHIIMDVSGSMQDAISPNAYALHFKGSLAQALCLSIIKKVGIEKGTMLFRFFASCPDRLRKADDTDGLADIARMVGLSDFNGGGTDIQSAIAAACADIKEAEKEGKGKAEILLVTDGESRMDEKKLEAELNGHIKLHVLDVSPVQHESCAQKALKKNAATFYKVDPAHISFEDIAKAAAD